jgi:hypothetical protein
MKTKQEKFVQYQKEWDHNRRRYAISQLSNLLAVLIISQGGSMFMVYINLPLSTQFIVSIYCMMYAIGILFWFFYSYLLSRWVGNDTIKYRVANLVSEIARKKEQSKKLHSDYSMLNSMQKKYSFNEIPENLRESASKLINSKETPEEILSAIEEDIENDEIWLEVYNVYSKGSTLRYLFSGRWPHKVA